MGKTTSRRQFLTVIGLAQLGMGATYADPWTITVPRIRAFEWLPFDWAQPQIMGMVMFISGLLCLTAVVTIGLQRHWAKHVERAAFGIATIPYTLLTLIFLGSAIFDNHYGGYTSAIAYGAMAAFVILSAGVVVAPSSETGSIPAPPKTKGRIDG